MHCTRSLFLLGCILLSAASCIPPHEGEPSSKLQTHEAVLTTTRVNALADATVRSGAYAADNFGTLTNIHVGPYTDGTQREAFISFRVDNYPAGTQSVRLVLGATSAGYGGNLYVTSSFSESTLTWNNKPARGALVAQSGPVAAGASATFDVSSVVTGAGTYHFVLASTDPDSVVYASREAIPVPVLEITHEGPALPTDDLPAPLRTVRVSTVTALRNALAAAVAGDRIEVADGTYSLSDWVVVTRSGTAANPIVITAANVGKAEIQGTAGFRFSNVSHVVIRGFKLTHQTRSDGSFAIGMNLDGSDNIRVTRNTFNLIDSGKAYWLYIEGADSTKNRIDHNIFQHKSAEGCFIVIYGMSTHDRIDHNYFADHSFTGSNGGEAIRIGSSQIQQSQAFTVVEYNLFERCNGDPEVISNKTSDNIIRYNTLRDNDGSVVMRHGHRATVEGNRFINNEGGVRIYGNDHKIIGNYFQGNTGTGVRSTIVLGSGSIADDIDGAEYDRPDRVQIAFNTLVNNTSHLAIGYGSGTMAPTSCRVENNILRGDSGTLVSITRAGTVTYGGNILWGSASDGEIPTSGYRSVDPRLVLGSDGYRIASDSPAINTAVNGAAYSAFTLDMDGQTRAGMFDVGADEYSTAAVTRRALTTANVGPAAP